MVKNGELAEGRRDHTRQEIAHIPVIAVKLARMQEEADPTHWSATPTSGAASLAHVKLKHFAYLSQP
jgi:hypothetical protein